MARKRIEDIVLQQNRELGYYPGDEAAHRAAGALADRFDAPTIISFTNLLTYIAEMGGQGYVVTLRERLTPDGRLAAEGEPGEYQTAMLRFEYESRDARVVAAPSPQDVAGIQVTEFSEAPSRIELKEPPVTDEEPETLQVEEEIRAEDAALAEADMAAGAETLPAA
jgi:hypothetical protein